MDILKTLSDREEEWIVAALRGITGEVNQHEYDLDVKPFITGSAKDFSDATDPDYKISREAVNKITREMLESCGVTVERIDGELIIFKRGIEVDRFPLDRKLSEQEVQRRNIEGSFIYAAPGKDIFSSIPPHLQP